MKKSLLSIVLIIAVTQILFSADYKQLWSYNLPKPYGNLLLSGDGNYLYEYYYSTALDLETPGAIPDTIINLPINLKTDRFE
jgi:hypothetical protein